MKKFELLYTINYKGKQVTLSAISAPFSSEFGHVTSAGTSEKIPSTRIIEEEGKEWLLKSSVIPNS